MRQGFFFQKSNSGDIARGRLQLLLASDKARIHPGLLNLIREDMLGVLSRYGEIDTENLDIRLVRMEAAGTRETVPVLSATFPVRTFTKRKEECF